MGEEENISMGIKEEGGRETPWGETSETSAEANKDGSDKDR